MSVDGSRHAAMAELLYWKLFQHLVTLLLLSDLCELDHVVGGA